MLNLGSIPAQTRLMSAIDNLGRGVAQAHHFEIGTLTPSAESRARTDPSEVFARLGITVCAAATPFYVGIETADTRHRIL